MFQEYTLEGEFGTATDDFSHTGRVVERSTYGTITCLSAVYQNVLHCLKLPQFIHIKSHKSHKFRSLHLRRRLPDAFYLISLITHLTTEIQ